jgi:hypothetical protein
MILQKTGGEVCVAFEASRKDERRLSVEFDVASVCDNELQLDDFVHFATYSVHPSQCKDVCNNNLCNR